MTPRLHGRLGAAFAASAGLVATAVLAHARAGGSITPAAVPLAAVALLAITAVAARVRWTPTRLVAGALVVQIAVHALMSVLGLGHAPGGHHGQHTAHAASHASTEMWLAHVAGAFAIVAVLHWGGRWLRSMPGLLRALLVSVARIRLVHLLVVRVAIAASRQRGRHPELTWYSRGPPLVV